MEMSDINLRKKQFLRNLTFKAIFLGFLYQILFALSVLAFFLLAKAGYQVAVCLAPIALCLIFIASNWLLFIRKSRAKIARAGQRSQEPDKIKRSFP
jgi:hypothetical protein